MTVWFCVDLNLDLSRFYHTKILRLDVGSEHESVKVKYWQPLLRRADLSTLRRHDGRKLRG
jgi:hypothetical protein